MSKPLARVSPSPLPLTPSLAYIYSLANRQGQGVLRSQLLRQHALHPNLPPRAARGAGPRRADRIHLSTSLTTNQTVCTDLTCLPTYQHTYLTRLEHSQAAALFISRLQAHTSKLQLYPPRCAHRADLEPRWPDYRTRRRGEPLGGKSRHSSHVKGTSVSLTAALFRPFWAVRSEQMAFSAQVYSGTKHAVEAMGAALRLELAPFEISVSVINPGCVHSEIFRTYKKDNVQLPTDHAQAETCKRVRGLYRL